MPFARADSGAWTKGRRNQDLVTNQSWRRTRRHDGNGARVRYGVSLLFGCIWTLLLAPLAVQAADAPVVAVRTGEHADLSRIVFDWTTGVGATVDASQPGQLIVVFDRPAGFDLAKASLKH